MKMFSVVMFKHYVTVCGKQGNHIVRNDHRSTSICVPSRRVDIIGRTSTTFDDPDQERFDIDSGESYVPNVERMQESDKPSACANCSQQNQHSRDP